MNKKIAAFFVVGLLPLFSTGQSLDKIANEAFVLTRMVDKFHVEPRPLNPAFSKDLFKAMLDQADEDRLFFTQNDIEQLGSYSTTLDKELKQRKTGFLTVFISIYQRRLRQADSLTGLIAKTPFNFYAPEKLTVAEDSLRPSSVAAMQQKLYKTLKLEALNELTADLPENFGKLAVSKQKHYVDSAGKEQQKMAALSLKRKINNILQNPNGINQYIGNIYCETIASCFDPHTEFFPPEQKETFESELGKQPFRFGFRLKPDKNGGILIDNLQPGSPAFKSGKLNKGDKFVSLQWEGGQAVDVSGISMDEFVPMIDESNHKKLLFTMKKADGATIQVSLQKEQTDDTEEDKVKSFILKGKNTIGYIYLPAFYQDWATGNEGLNGCANDVGREIIKLKKENINGLILDLRYNGGGSMGEAAELAGIFIDAGPVAQIKGRDAKIYSLKDVDRGTIYDGPLVILVNGYSASASELVAGTLQDYNRAVIIGSPTYGKATGQMVLPMDTTVSPENSVQKETEDYVKITTSKLYRVTGTTAQFKGVQPDIVLPDVLDAYITKEKDSPFALKAATIGPNKYYTPYPALDIGKLRASVQQEIDTSRYLNAVKKIIADPARKNTPKDVSLNFNDALLQADENTTGHEGAPAPENETKHFIVVNNQSETNVGRADDAFENLNKEFIHQLLTDAFINIAYEVLAQMKSK